MNLNVLLRTLFAASPSRTTHANEQLMFLVNSFLLSIRVLGRLICGTESSAIPMWDNDGIPICTRSIPIRS
ncbi:hypothetical protein BGW36DRAFT_384666 [Talaromyces proteolyticus]|uniref:Uncharacterized protein n=1 Tax=Talaromyces proteolyticus TaxID=1131652 RepID=A0AAD4KLJ7_9EURO|nr:uncharacterized protein BGW36DRAFT_384666 [Talaromyces proteolyticus]KAH8694287.1 hypothetical protein BGW36DRAFT_384666 [Talaromyces proteolyticus]